MFQILVGVLDGSYVPFRLVIIICCQTDLHGLSGLIKKDVLSNRNCREICKNK